jgi:dynein heavy chain
MNVTKFTQEIRKQTEATVSATIDMYTQITANLLPIPSKFHYTFNLRDVAKVFQGILMSKPQSVADEDTYKKLWLHECSRVFGDRLCTEKDRSYF